MDLGTMRFHMIDEEKCQMGKVMEYEEIVKMLADNYTKIEESIVNQILLNVSNQYPTAGSYRETVWKFLFEMMIPKKYCIEQGVFIIDSYGHVSKEVDLAIFDEMYTPYIFNYGEIKFIPIEAVAAVVQCKSNTINKKVANAIIEWEKSIDSLFTSMDSVARIAVKMVDNNEASAKSTMQTATRPIKILCAMATMKSLKQFEEDFDIILTVDKKNKRLLKYIKGKKDSLGSWNASLNHSLKNNTGIPEIDEEIGLREKRKIEYNSKSRNNLLQELAVGRAENNEIIEENVLLSLIFQLNQLLMILNNPMLFPHRAYAKCFTKVLSGFGKEEDNSEQK